MLTTRKGAITPEEKKEKIEAARAYHAELLDFHGAKSLDFNLKLQFFDNGTQIVGIFPSEFKKENGFFLELADSNLDPTDTKRTVYRLPPMDNYEDVYNILRSGAYAVPLEELELVESIQKQAPPKFDVDMSNLHEVKDENISNMTITDFAAIMWMKPVSDKKWLNNLINQSI